jgi:hypothetical protein
MSTNLPAAIDGDLTAGATTDILYTALNLFASIVEFGPNAQRDVAGFIYMSVAYQLQSTPNGKVFQQKFKKMSQQFPNE